ncbi:conserved hypothetical protein [uncultured Defluviicoccus sp.]|uniref:Uncharacterized protein n=1 Tax=metagenome TaxID=256318 RepID=A0A380TGW5_9ZZZZ|nr:conserved hypothetical protein [uncultured Defluviicoccus sp.]
MAPQSMDQLIEGYFLATTKAIGTLFRDNLLPHSLVIMYSTIDACGLLGAPANQSTATSKSFKEWVRKYVLTFPGLEFNEVDLWSARCGVLHTFTSESDLSASGKARQLHYYTGDKSAPHIQTFIAFTKTHEGGTHLPVHYGDLAESILGGMKAFIPNLAASCTASPAHLARLQRVMQTYSHEAAP